MPSKGTIKIFGSRTETTPCKHHYWDERRTERIWAESRYVSERPRLRERSAKREGPRARCWEGARSSLFLAYNSYDCVAPYVDIILYRGRFWAKSAASGSVRWCCFRSCWTVLRHVMRGRPSCLLRSAGWEANRILLASALLSMRNMPK